MFASKNPKGDLYQYIIKRHAYYEAKLEVIDEKINEDFGPEINKLEISTKNSTRLNRTITEDEKINSLIRKSKHQIEVLKKKMIQEEKNLLGLYKLKKK